MRMPPEAVIIGAGIVDIPLSPVDRGMFDVRSQPLESIAMHLGGDAANEAAALSRMGRRAALISLVGDDGAGDFVCGALERHGVDTRWVVRREGLDTGINIVLVRPDGERSFITNKNGSLRRLSLREITPALEDPALTQARVCCLASLFVSPMLSLSDTEALLGRVKAMGLIVCADTTRPKRGETVDALGGVLSKIDYFFPNLAEAVAITGRDDPDAIADALLGAGVRHVILKLGEKGCLAASAQAREYVPGFAVPRCVDTTGAGDTFAAGFISALMEGRDMLSCAEWANAAASICVENVGASPEALSREAVQERLETGRRTGIDSRCRG